MTNYQSRCFLGEMSAWPCSAALLSFHTANTESIGKEKHKVYILTQCSIRGLVGEGNPESGLLSSLSFVPCLLGSDVARKQQCKLFGHLWAEVLCGVRGERQRNFMRGGRQKKADTVLGKLHRLLNISLSACFSPITQDPSLPLTSPLPWIFLWDCHKNGVMSTCLNWTKSVVLRLVLTMENRKYQCYMYYKSV